LLIYEMICQLMHRLLINYRLPIVTLANEYRPRIDSELTRNDRDRLVDQFIRQSFLNNIILKAIVVGFAVINFQLSWFSLGFYLAGKITFYQMVSAVVFSISFNQIVDFTMGAMLILLPYILTIIQVLRLQSQHCCQSVRLLQLTSDSSWQLVMRLRLQYVR